VGQYRIIYSIHDDMLMVLVVTVGHRKDVYEKLLEKYTPEKLLSILPSKP
jgi:hypothetical protein